MSLSDIANGAAAPSAAPDSASATSGSGPSFDPVETALKLAGGGLKNTLHAGEALGNALQGLQRGVAGTGSYTSANIHHNLLDYGAIPEYAAHPGEIISALRQGASWAGDPKKQKQTAAFDRDIWSTEHGGIVPTDAQINAHLSGAPATAARWAAQTGSELASDPMTIAPVGAIGKVAKVLGGGKVLEAAAKLPGAARLGEARSALFNPEHNLRDLTEHGQNVVEQIRNLAKNNAEKAARVENATIVAERKAISKGVLSPQVQSLFAKYGVAAPKGLKPSGVIKALDEARAAHTAEQVSHGLTQAGIIGKNAGQATLFGTHIAPDIFKDTSPAGIEKAMDGVMKHIKPPTSPEGAAKYIAQVNQQLKGMFLAIPLPHVGNLVNLAYNRYGLATTLRGLKYAAQEATGRQGAKLRALVDDLEKAGADNQYSKIFSEVNGFEPIRQVQRFANKAQDVVLNPVERGLRAAMLESEQRAGRFGADAARNIHKALGSDADTGFTKFLNKLPLSQFPRFHTQTAIGSYGHALAHAPGRVTGFQHVFGGPDQKQNGHAHFHLSTPSASGLKMMGDPLDYFASPSTLGGLLNLKGDYSPAWSREQRVSLR